MFVLAGVAVFRIVLRSVVAGPPVPGVWVRRIEGELALWGMFAGFAAVVFDLGRLGHQAFAFYGGFEPVTLELVSTIANETLWGAGWKVQALSAAAAAALLAGAYRRWPGAWIAAVPTVAVAVVSRPLTGHAMEAGSWFSLPAILQAIHVAGAAAWMGTLFAMIVIGRRWARELPAGDRARVIAAMVNGFSPLALTAATALFVAGSATAFLYLGSPAAVFATVYGLVFATKFALFCVIVGIGYFNWQRVGPALEKGASATGDPAAAQALLLRSAGAELTMAVAVLVLTAVLVALPMPAG